MSAMPARVTELSEVPHVGTPPGRAQLRADRRAAQKIERRGRQRWAVIACSILGAFFALTVGVLDVLH